ncbi:MAG: hypothetical protein CMG74_07510 [Candidatus Marinimicrobia bacterium]|nr:hypothetical protein [Candidatus Neomarinimicrobiota bacterium]
MIHKSYLVTGGADFIGSALARKLVDLGHSVIIIDNLSTGFRKNISERATFIEGDCSDKKVIAKLENAQFDAIFHIAGQSSGEISFENPIYDLNANTLSTLLLLKYAKEYHCKKFIYASTMSVYGDQPDSPVKESAKNNPLSFYAIGKIASENYMKLFVDFGMTNTALRLFNTYGPGQNMENLNQGMVSIFLEQAFSSKRIIIKGDKNRFRDYVFIDDVVDAFIKAEAFDDDKYRVINIGTGIRTTVNELLGKMISMLPYEITVKFVESTLGDIHGIYADVSLANSSLDWVYTHNIDEGLKLMLNWRKGK